MVEKLKDNLEVILIKYEDNYILDSLEFFEPKIKDELQEYLISYQCLSDKDQEEKRGIVYKINMVLDVGDFFACHGVVFFVDKENKISWIWGSCDFWNDESKKFQIKPKNKSISKTFKSALNYVLKDIYKNNIPKFDLSRDSKFIKVKIYDEIDGEFVLLINVSKGKNWDVYCSNIRFQIKILK